MACRSPPTGPSALVPDGEPATSAAAEDLAARSWSAVRDGRCRPGT